MRKNVFVCNDPDVVAETATMSLRTGQQDILVSMDTLATFLDSFHKSVSNLFSSYEVVKSGEMFCPKIKTEYGSILFVSHGRVEGLSMNVEDAFLCIESHSVFSTRALVSRLQSRCRLERKSVVCEARNKICEI